MSLRLQINLLLTAMMALFIAALGWQQIDSTRRSVREEIQAAHRVATQVLTRVSFVYRRAGLDGMVEFLHQLGRVRANEITLHDDAGTLLYQSPPSPYKAGRDAPDWFAAIVATPEEPRNIPLEGGNITVNANPSRAILDGWDELVRLLSVGVIVFAFANLVVYWMAGRAIRPLTRVVGALQAVGRGEYETRLPVLPGKEGASISRAFNGMAQAIGESVSARREAAEAAARLAQNRELTQLIQSRIEDERGALARELHDEMGQSLTAMKSLAAAIAQRDGLEEDTRAEDGRSEGKATESKAIDSRTIHSKRSESNASESKASESGTSDSDTSRQAARAIVQIADHLYQVVHGIIPRLRPLALDNFGLADALEDLLGDWRLREPRIEFSMHVEELPEALPDAIATAVYRIVQEALTNSIRHAGASRIRVDLQRDGETLVVRIGDNGRGLTADRQVPGHYGVIGMRERAMALGGTLELAPADGGGLDVVARIPT